MFFPHCPSAMHSNLILKLLFYAASSSALLVLNKISITAIPNASVLLFVQLLSTVFFILGPALAGTLKVQILPSRSVIRAYASVAFVFLTTIYSNFQVVSSIGVNSFVVLRCGTPLIISILDWGFLGREFPKGPSLLPLAGIFLFASSYSFLKLREDRLQEGQTSAGALSPSMAGLFWALVWLSSFVLDMVYIKYVVHKYPCSGMERTLYQNFLALPMLLLPCLLLEQTDTYSSLIAADKKGVAAVLLSCVAGAVLSYTGMSLRSELSATSFTVVGIMCKMASSVLNEIFVAQEKHKSTLVCLAGVIVSSALYKPAPMRQLDPVIGSIHREQECCASKQTSPHRLFRCWVPWLLASTAFILSTMFASKNPRDHPFARIEASEINTFESINLVNLVEVPSSDIRTTLQVDNHRKVGETDTAGKQDFASPDRLLCPAGFFGNNCTQSIKNFFFEHNVYDGFQPLADARHTGWGPEKSFYEQFVSSISPNLVVEVGVWRGMSLTHIASSMRDIRGGGVVIAVDTWLGAPEFWTRELTAGSPDPSRDLRFRFGYPHVYYDFLSNVVNHRLQEFVIPLPVPSRIAAQLIKRAKYPPQLIHIDAAHEYADVVEDIDLWFPLLDDAGVLLGDDFVPAWPGVVRAACEFADKISVKLYHSNTKWWIYKKDAKTHSFSQQHQPNQRAIEHCISQA